MVNRNKIKVHVYELGSDNQCITVAKLTVLGTKEFQNNY